MDKRSSVETELFLQFLLKGGGGTSTLKGGGASSADLQKTCLALRVLNQDSNVILTDSKQSLYKKYKQGFLEGLLLESLESINSNTDESTGIQLAFLKSSFDVEKKTVEFDLEFTNDSEPIIWWDILRIYPAVASQNSIPVTFIVTDCRMLENGDVGGPFKAFILADDWSKFAGGLQSNPFDRDQFAKGVAYKIGNLNPSIRILKAILSQNPAPLFYSMLADPIPPANPFQAVNYLEPDSFVSKLSKGLNLPQIYSLRYVLTWLPNQRLTLIQGPPGTGKTKTTVLMVIGAIEQGKSVIFAGPSNGSVVNGARALIAALDLLGIPAIKDSFLSNMVIVGLGERLGITKNDPLHSLLLTQKVLSLKDANLKWTNAAAEFVLVGKTESSFEEYRLNFTQWWKVVESAWPIVQKIWTLYLPSCFISPTLSFSALFADFKKDVVKHMDLFKDFAKPYTGRTDHFLSLISSHTFNPDGPLAFLDGLFCSSLSSLQAKFQVLCTSIQSFLSPFLLSSSLDGIIMSGCRLCFSTVSVTARSAISLQFASRLKGDLVAFIDEAGQLLEAELLVLIDRQRHVKPLSHVVLVGDDKQLSPTVLSLEAKSKGYGVSVFERLKQKGVYCSMLLIQYRMHPRISEWSSKMFYDSKLVDAPHLLERQCPVTELETSSGDAFGGPLYLLDLADGEETRTITGSYSNEIEAKSIIKMLKHLKEKIKDVEHQGRFRIGIITFYAAQKMLILETILGKKNLNSSHSKILAGKEDIILGQLQISVNTVDAFQGQERDLIILSTVRSNSQKSIGFAASLTRLNVAWTRAKKGLWIVCNVSTFSNDPTWKSLFEHIQNVGIVGSTNTVLFQAVKKEILISKVAGSSSSIAAAAAPLVVRNFLWNVLFTKQSKNAIEKAGPYFVKKFVDQIESLASGIMKKRIPKTKAGTTKHPVLFFKIEKVSIIWSIELESLADNYVQVIQIWDVCDESLAVKSVNHVRHILESRSSDYSEACLLRTTDENVKSGNALVPTVIPKSDGSIVFYKGKQQEKLDTIGLEIVEDLTNYVKIYRMTIQVMSLMHKDIFRSMELPFVLGDEERELVENEDSLFILGRSGTGKTTVMLSRILLKELLAEKAGTGNEQTQWLITCNDRLKTSSEMYYEKLRLSYQSLADLQKPVFYSFDQVLEFIEKQLPNRFFSSFHEDEPNVGSIGDSLEELLLEEENDRIGLYRKDDRVSFEKFEVSFYPRFEASVTKRFSASLLWTEFNSVIKGALSLLSGKTNSLTKKEYINVSNTRISVLSEEDRGQIYDCWKVYETQKSKIMAFDLSDLTMFVYRQLELRSTPLFLIDFIYLDEVQDLTQIQIAIFNFICKNKTGFVFGGDTAQTIAQGVGFRFQDVRYLFYEHFLQGTADGLPKVWQLKQNFRTHSGILALSNTLIEKIFEFFPNTVDKVESETGALFQGARPWFIEDSTDGLAKVLFGADQAHDGDMSSVEMGSNQAIIVRNDTVKMNLGKRIPGALILTIFESKGMEFEDVLLYNFFKDSNSSYSKWRLLVNDNATSYHGFDEKRDNDLCTELKALYVAVTRAKCQLVMIDESEKTNPIFDWWKDLGVVSFISGGPNLSFAKASSPEEWNARGDEFLDRGQLESAIICFTRAKNSKKLYKSQAMLDSRNGEKLLALGNESKSKQAFISAAESYLQIDEELLAAECYLKGKRYESAADLFFKNGNVFKALAICLETKALSQALSFFKLFKSNDDSSMVNMINRYARFFALAARRKGEKGLVSEFISFVSVPSARAFLKRYGEIEILYSYDLKMKNFGFLAESAELKQQYSDCCKFYIKDSQNEKALKIWLRYFLKPRLGFVKFLDLGTKYKTQATENEFTSLWESCIKILGKYKSDLAKECQIYVDLLSGKQSEQVLPSHLRVYQEKAEYFQHVQKFKEIEDSRENKQLLMSKLRIVFTKGASLLNKLTSVISLLKSITKTPSIDTPFVELFSASSIDNNLFFSNSLINEFKFDKAWKKGVSWQKFSSFICSRLMKWKESVYEELAVASFRDAPKLPSFLKRLNICPKILMEPLVATHNPGGGASCKCPMNHFLEETIDFYDDILALRLGAILFLNAARGLLGSEIALREQTRFILSYYIFPDNQKSINPFMTGKAYTSPSVKFALSVHLEGLADDGSLENNIRKYIIHMVSKDPFNFAPLASGDFLILLDQSVRWLLDGSSSKSLRQFVSCGSQFLVKLFEAESLKFHPRLLLDLIELIFPALLSLKMGLSSVYLPASSVSKLSLLEGTELLLWTNKILNAVKLEESLNIFAQVLVGSLSREFENWYYDYFTKPQFKMNVFDRKIMMTRLLKAAFCIVLNMENLDEKVVKAFLSKDNLSHLFTKYDLKDFLDSFFAEFPSNPWIKQKGKRDVIDDWKERIFRAFKSPEWNDSIVCLDSRMPAVCPEAPLVIIEGDSFNLDAFYEKNFTVWVRPKRVKKGQDVSKATSGSDVQPKIVESDTPLIKDPFENILPWMRKNLGRIRRRVHEKVELRKRDLSPEERIRAEVDFELSGNARLHSEFVNVFLPRLLELEAESSRCKEGLRLADTKPFYSFRFLKYGIDEITELLHGRIEVITEGLESFDLVKVKRLNWKRDFDAQLLNLQSKLPAQDKEINLLLKKMALHSEKS